MKTTFFVAALAFVGLAALPNQSLALSCLDPEGMVEHFTNESGYQIILATPTEQKEFVKNEADETDPNTMYPEGYTGQFLTIAKSYRGSVPDKEWVYFDRNGTWNYLCVGEPPTLKGQQIYILRQAEEMFGVTKVAGVYGVDSELGKSLIKAVEADKSGDFDEPQVFEAKKDYWLQQLYDELKEMAFIVKVKLAEWNFWK